MSKQLGFYFEQKHCTGCKTCQVACRDKQNLPNVKNFRQVHSYEGGGFTVEQGVIHHNVYAYWISVSCNHCINPACAAVCPKGAIYKRAEDGLVLVNEELCIGCRRCLAACPYQAPQFDETSHKMKKCDFCQELLAEGKIPVCIASCPMRVLGYGQLAELQRKYGKINWIKGLPVTRKLEPAWVLVPHRAAVELG